ncbi:hypothetical protein [Amycolatopsis circi]|uniref:hypothetical protein n=1 Tax=Amycolatopsis circi TaxID=871959 RepID=UPI000E263CB9|nr:hypothetical protein [Amycolatopsis circi]
MKIGKTLMAASALGIALAGIAAPAASADTAAPASAQGKHTASIKCSKPSGAKSNYSWGDGVTNVTVYFNNHCSHKVSAGIVLKDMDGALSVQCMTTNGGTSGKKKFHIGADHSVARIQKGCKL